MTDALKIVEDCYSDYARFVNGFRSLPSSDDGFKLDTSSRFCLLAQYFTAMGLTNVTVSPVKVKFGAWKDGLEVSLPPEWNSVAIERPHTFGRALRRALVPRKSLVQKIAEFFRG